MAIARTERTIAHPCSSPLPHRPRATHVSRSSDRQPLLVQDNGRYYHATGTQKERFHRCITDAPNMPSLLEKGKSSNSIPTTMMSMQTYSAAAASWCSCGRSNLSLAAERQSLESLLSRLPGSGTKLSEELSLMSEFEGRCRFIMQTWNTTEDSPHVTYTKKHQTSQKSIPWGLLSVNLPNAFAAPRLIRGDDTAESHAIVLKRDTSTQLSIEREISSIVSLLTPITKALSYVQQGFVSVKIDYSQRTTRRANASYPRH